MKKATVLASLIAARLAHEEWLECGKKLVKGEDFFGVQKPLKYDKCAFGQWINMQKEHIEKISGFEAIEALHKEFHEIYERLYINAPRVHKSKGIFSNKKLQAIQKGHLINDFHRLENVSQRLVRRLAQVEKVVTTMSERLFERHKKLSKSV